ncbi:tetratricopeptide repeat protein [Candidatus Curtissbacteria bacterium]|nr:tetratricopeptide repeat protein [Candidatus Curtissbacteria bacterium]
MRTSDLEPLEIDFKELFVPLTSLKAFFIIFIIGIIVFSNSLFNNFVGDDFSQIVRNQAIRSLDNIPLFFTGSTFYSGNALEGVYYKPLLTTFFSLISTTFGYNFFTFHFFQIALHILSTFILFLFLNHFFKKSLSLFLSIIFLVHPINSEAVFFISATQEPLFFLFGILALWTLIKTKSKKYLFIVSTLIFLSLLSKETGILFLILSVIYLLIFNRKHLLFFLGTSAPLIASYLLLRMNAISIHNKPAVPIAELNLIERFINMPEMVFFYLETFIFPLDLAHSYHWAHKEISFDHFFVPLIIDLLVIAVMVYFAFIFYKKHFNYFKPYIFFMMWFLFGVLLHLQIIPLDSTVAERWFYFPIVGVLGMTGILLENFKFNLRIRWNLVIAIVIILLFSTRTFFRSFDWRDQLTLSSHDVNVSKDSYILENQIGAILTEQGKFEEAKVHLERSISLYPSYSNYSNLGVFYARTGDYQKAREAYLEALKFRDYLVAYESLGLLSLANENHEENIDFLKSSLQKYPQSAKLWFYLAIQEYKLNRVDDAKNSISKAYQYSETPEIDSAYQRIMKNLPLNVTLDLKEK